MLGIMNFMRSKHTVVISAAAFAVAHVICLIAFFIIAGKWGVLWAMFVDYPLYWLLQQFAAGETFLQLPFGWVIVSFAGGTIFYSCIGAVFGWFLKGLYDCFHADA
jgi:hypothetical protein